MGHWTPTGVEPKDYDDDDEISIAKLDEGPDFLWLHPLAET